MWSIPTILIVLGVVALVGVFAGFFKLGKQNMWKGYLVGGAILGIGLIMAGIIANPLASLTTQAVAPAPVQTSANVVSTPEGKHQLTVETLKIQTCLKYSNACDSYSGTLRIYPEGTDTSAANAKVVDSVTLASGVGSSTNAYIKTDKPFSVVLDGASNYYLINLGKSYEFSYANFNPNTASYSLLIENVPQIATIDNLLTSNSTDINGQSTYATGTDELGVTNVNSADTILTYDESAGDASFYIQPTISFSGANKEIQKPSICFRDDQSASGMVTSAMVTAIQYQLVSGTDFGLPSDWTNYLSQFTCISLGDVVKSGTSSKIKLTFTYDIAEIGANDDYELVIDDLGGIDAKDLKNNVGATKKIISFDDQA